MTRALSISLLGSFSVLLDGKPVHALETPRLRSLIGYLILHRDSTLYRDGLAEALWPDLTEGESRSNLRKLLYRLTQGLPDLERYVEISHTRIRWRSEADADLDVVELERVCRTAPSREGLTLASSLYRGELLAGADDVWMIPERERLQRLFAGYLEAGIARLEEDRDYSTALVWAQRLVSLNPLNEKAYGKEMRLHALCGDKAAAIRTYRTCVAMLEKELGESCDPALTAEYERIRGTGLLNPPLTPLRHRLVGRHHEWRLLLDTWQRAAAGRSTLVLLKAEPGRGKTRLAEELTVWVERQGFATAFVRCQETSTELAFSTVADLLHTLPLQALAPLWLTELTRLLPELADTHPDLPPARPMVEPWQQLRFYQAITRAFLLRQPLLLVIDDVHWCDVHTLKWLHHLYNTSPAPRVLTLCTLRSGDDPPGDYLLSRLVPSLQRSGQLVTLELPPLEPQFTLELASLELASLEPASLEPQFTLEPASLEPQFTLEPASLELASPARPAQETGASRQPPVLSPAHAARLVEESGGNPLFVLELMRGQQLSPASPPLQGIPPTLQGLIVSRLKSLSPAGYHVINLAAVAGACFSLSLLMRALSDEQRALVDGLDELVRRQLIREREPKVYEFTHPRLHDIVYGELSSARRGLLHRLVAETLVA